MRELGATLHITRVILFLLAINILTVELSRAQQRYQVSRTEIEFEPNRGQSPPDVLFLARAGDTMLRLRSHGMDLLLRSANAQRTGLQLNFLASTPATQVSASDVKDGVSNYFLGNAPATWQTHIPHFGRIRYAQLYPGIDTVFYGKDQQLEYDFVVAPGSDYRQIRMGFGGADRISLVEDGSLHLASGGHDISFRAPHIYQWFKGKKQSCKGGFVLLANSEVRFRIMSYDRSQPLIIDPVLRFSTFIDNNTSGGPAAVTTDAAGNTYLTGLTFSSNYPTSAGAFQKACNSCDGEKPDVFVTKLNASGTGILYSTFLGGSDYDQPSGIVVDKNGDAIITGHTQSPDFPIKHSIPFGFTGVSIDLGFVTSLAPDGSSLNYSSLLGGAASPGQGTETEATSIAVDSAGNAYVSGQTESPFFPVTKGALNNAAPAYPNSIVFVTKFLPTGALGYSALVGDPSPQNGGGGLIGVSAIQVDASGSAYIAGQAGSLWPTTTGAYQPQIGGPAPYAAPFVTKLSPDASSLTYSTFVGNGNVTGLAVNGSGDAWITGSPNGPNFPTTTNAYKRTEPSSNCCIPFFAELNAMGSQLLYSSFFYGDSSVLFGGTQTSGISLDHLGNIWLAGFTNDPRLPLQHPIQSLPGSQSNPFSFSTGFVSRFDPTGTKLTFSTFFGGPSGQTHLSALALDPTNKVHITGFAGQDLFTTPGAFLSSVPPPPPFVEGIYGFAAVLDANTPAASLCIAYPQNQGLFFGGVQVGTSSTQKITITNCGTASLTISSIEVPNSVYDVPDSQNGCKSVLAVGQSCTFLIVFKPTSVSEFDADASITSNASIPTSHLSVSGQGTVPVIQVGSSLTFDPQFLNQTSPQVLLFVSNAGEAPLIIDLGHTSISGDFAYTQSGCNQPLFQGFQNGCIFFVTFTPKAAGKRTGIFTIVSNDPANPAVAVDLSGTGFSAYPVPSLTSVNPPTVAKNATGVTLTIFGNNFFPASVVRVNGVAQATTYQNSTQLQATVDSSLLAKMGEFAVTVANPAPGGGVSGAQTLTVYQSIPLSASALVYEPFSRFLYAATAADATENPNSIIPVDPLTGSVGAAIPVGNNPKKLAVSDDGRYLYVALDGDHAIQRINLQTRLLEKTISLPVDPSFGKLRVFEMHVVPGQSKSVVASLAYENVSPFEAGIALFGDSGLVNWLPFFSGNSIVAVDSFAFAGTPSEVYGVPFTISNPFFQIFTTDNTGIHAQSAGFNDQYENAAVASDGKFLYLADGTVWNPSTRSTVGTYNPSLFFATSIIPDKSLGRTFFLDQFGSASGQAGIDSYDQTTFALTGSLGFPSFFSLDMLGLNRWGSDGFSFFVNNFIPAEGSNQLIILRSSIAHVNTGANPKPTLAGIWPSTLTAGGQNFILAVSGTNFVRGSIVNWKGGARSTNFISSTQVTADIPAADIASAGTPSITVTNPSPGGGTSTPLTFTIAGISSQVILTPSVKSLTKNSSGNYVAVLQIANQGSIGAANVKITTATLNSIATVSLPAEGQSIVSGGTATVTLVFGASAGSSAAAVALHVSGTYNAGTAGASGNWGGTLRVTLP
jgi:hypothetical protein